MLRLKLGQKQSSKPILWVKPSPSVVTFSSSHKHSPVINVFETLTLTLTLAEKRIILNPPYKLTLPLQDLLSVAKQKLHKNSPKTIPRPPNGWILFRKDFQAKNSLEFPRKSLKIQDISKFASKAWQDQSVEVKQFFGILQKMAVEQHHLMHPEYKFNPKKKVSYRKGWVFKDSTKETYSKNDKRHSKSFSLSLDESLDKDSCDQGEVNDEAKDFNLSVFNPSPEKSFMNVFEHSTSSQISAKIDSTSKHLLDQTEYIASFEDFFSVSPFSQSNISETDKVFVENLIESQEPSWFPNLNDHFLLSKNQSVSQESLNLKFNFKDLQNGEITLPFNFDANSQYLNSNTNIQYSPSNQSILSNDVSFDFSKNVFLEFENPFTSNFEIEESLFNMPDFLLLDFDPISEYAEFSNELLI
ncbi:hypothetical protein G9A89_006527 [Geosiphon pyriformis]|nr:hypothetical protein G9A89_006527 [Geosiphon pyriformis]